jgi:hypothetical protein
MDTRHGSFHGMTGARQWSAFWPSTRYTDARPILSTFAISEGRMPCAFISRTREASIEGGANDVLKIPDAPRRIVLLFLIPFRLPLSLTSVGFSFRIKTTQAAETGTDAPAPSSLSAG